MSMKDKSAYNIISTICLTYLVIVSNAIQDEGSRHTLGNSDSHFVSGKL